MDTAHSRTRNVPASDMKRQPPLRRIPGCIERLLPPEACRFLGVTPEKLKRLRLSGRLAYYRHGHRSISFDVRDLETYLDQVYVPAYSPPKPREIKKQIVTARQCVPRARGGKGVGSEELCQADAR